MSAPANRVVVVPFATFLERQERLGRIAEALKRPDPADSGIESAPPPEGDAAGDPPVTKATQRLADPSSH
jgi:hypothetical protein